MYRLLIRPILFLFDPERVHHISFSTIKFLSKIGLSGLFKSIFLIEDKSLERELFGLKFKIVNNVLRLIL